MFSLLNADMHKLALCIVICGAVAAVKGTEADPATSADIKYRATVVEYDPITPSGIRGKMYTCVMVSIKVVRGAGKAEIVGKLEQKK